MPFELARTLLVQGTIERRARHRQTARDSLGRALTIFEQLGSPLWAAKARRELSKITTRPSMHGLTETENRVATLVTQGLTNREIQRLNSWGLVSCPETFAASKRHYVVGESQ